MLSVDELLIVETLFSMNEQHYTTDFCSEGSNGASPPQQIAGCSGVVSAGESSH
jgi:hypothetical protein